MALVAVVFLVHIKFLYLLILKMPINSYESDKTNPISEILILNLENWK